MELVEQLTTSGWRDAPGQTDALQGQCLKQLGYSTLSEFLKDQTLRITIVLIHGGNASRWQKSLAEHPDLAHQYHATPTDPRGLALVPNFFMPEPTKHPIPAITYAYWGMKPLLANAQGQAIASRKHLTHFRHPRDAGRFAIAAHLAGIATDLRPALPRFRDNPPGHAAVLCEFLPEFAESDIVITQFGSDPISPRTAARTALVLRAMQKAQASVGALIPTAPGGNYPVSLDEAGLVRSLAHNKLGQVGADASSLTTGGSNIGTRVYDAASLCAILQVGQDNFNRTGAFLPDGGEFSLDHVDAQIAESGRCRQLFIATADEAHPAKDISKLPRCLQAQQNIIQHMKELS